MEDTFEDLVQESDPSDFSQTALTTPLFRFIENAPQHTATYKDEYLNMNILSDIIRDVTEVIKIHNKNQKFELFSRALEYNLKNVKHHRLQLTVFTYKNIIGSQALKVDNIKLAYILGWCAEMLNAALMIYEDMMNDNATRDGRICWHKLQDVGMVAINDAIMFENAIYILIKKYFGNVSYFLELLDLFREIEFIAASGKCQDMLSSKDSVKLFTMEKYKATAAIKTAPHTIYLPFTLAMHLAGLENQETFGQTKQILLKIGEFYQIQNDYWDCFVDHEIADPFGTDIQDNKCSWLAVVCMERANDEQKQIMIECYGKKDPVKVKQVKELYRAVDLSCAYAAKKEESYNTIQVLIKQSSNRVPQEALLQLLNNIYKRESNLDLIYSSDY